MKKKLNYKPGSISFADGFLGASALGRQKHEEHTMVYDHKKALSILDKLDKDHIINVECGLDGDWGCNSQTIYDKKEGYDNDIWFHDASTWATPIMIVNYDDRPSETYEVYKKLKNT
jgi:hypothetical protein